MNMNMYEKYKLVDEAYRKLRADEVTHQDIDNLYKRLNLLPVYESACQICTVKEKDNPAIAYSCSFCEKYR